MERTPERITMRRIAEEILAVINLERGLGYTVRELALRPGSCIRTYLLEDRHRMVKPFALLALIVTVATFMSLRFLPLGDGLWPAVEADLREAHISGNGLILAKWFFNGTQKYFNIVFVSSLPGLALGTFLLFQEKGYNLAEHLVINTYIFSFQTLIYIMALPLMTMQWAAILASLAMAGYTLYAFVRVFEQRFWKVLGKGIIAYMISQALTSILLLLAGLCAWIWLSLQ
ncbi:MAG: DUF3667 domain-containing protein [Phaeodactylibacter sp.]|nr:DUF3667 domain-containing protein [Phaeodactylibacter sp.]MCB9274600.1 DUF3667 domain-containing protein [Lewinellaceae bacterium]